MRLRGAPVLDAWGRPVGRRDDVDLEGQLFLDTRPPAPVERRPATPQELARLAAPAATLVRPSDAMAVMRPASRPAQQPPGAEAPPPTVTPPAARPEAPAGGHPWRNYRSVMGASAPAPSRQEEPVTTPAEPLALPCGDCLHAPVCGLKAAIPDLDHRVHLETLAEGLVLAYRAASVACDHHLPAGQRPVVQLVAEPEPIRAEHGGEGWRTVPVASIEEIDAKLAAAPKGRTRRPSEPPSQESRKRGAAVSSALYAERRRVKDAQAIEQLREHGGNAEAVGRAMGVTGAAVKQWIARMAAAGELPADVAALVEARGRRKVPA